MLACIKNNKLTIVTLQFCNKGKQRCGYLCVSVCVCERLGVYKYKHSAVWRPQRLKNKTADLVCIITAILICVCQSVCRSVCVCLSLAVYKPKQKFGS